MWGANYHAAISKPLPLKSIGIMPLAFDTRQHANGMCGPDSRKPWPLVES